MRAYRRCLARLYRFLPGDKLLRRGTLELWRGELLQTYTPRTVNVNVSAVNSYLEHIARGNSSSRGRCRRRRTTSRR